MALIKCPHCHHEFAMEEAVADQYKKDLREQMIAFTQKKDREFQEKTALLEREKQAQTEAFAGQLEKEKQAIRMQLEENMRKSIAGDYETRMKMLEESNRDNEEKLKTARQRELEFLQLQQQMKTREEELELQTARRLQEERTKLAEEIRKVEQEKNAARETEYQLRLKEMQKQVDDQKKLAEEMKRKAEQGSMQLQGEVQELELERMLAAAFPFDAVEEVGKGKRGADCTLTVRNATGQECGKIIFESKRTQEFGGDWIEKLKSDMRSKSAQVAVLVTKVMPKDMSCFGEKNGVWICNFAEVLALTAVLRDGIVRVAGAARAQQNKGDKMQLMYDYLTSTEFAEQWSAMREGFRSMRDSIQREREVMEKLWKSREKQLEKVLLSAAHIKGSVDGIAGQDSIDMNLLNEITGIE